MADGQTGLVSGLVSGHQPGAKRDGGRQTAYLPGKRKTDQQYRYTGELCDNMLGPRYSFNNYYNRRDTAYAIIESTYSLHINAIKMR